MNLRKTSTTLWGIGLSEDDQRRIVDFAGPGFILKNWPCSQMPGVDELEEQEPLALWIPLHIWNTLTEARQMLFQRHTGMQRILLLEPGNSIEDMEKALGMGFMEIVRTPVDQSTVENILERATEIKSLYNDIYRMTQEIYLERELLARKNEQLGFINTFVSHTAESLDTTTILAQACEDLTGLFPVKLVQGAVWSRNLKAEVEAELYLSQAMDSRTRELWVEFITESANKLIDAPVKNYTITLLDTPASQEPQPDFLPSKGRVAIIPLNSGQETFGCLVLLANQTFNLGRDQVELLHSASKHLALALRNAMLFNEARIQAQFDGLTKLYNRKHFDSRLEEELLRHQRYMHQLSVVMLDLDHFKQINDVYGHQAGDLVLKETGKMLQDSIRTTDFAARYGGEEFALLLPQTDQGQAWALAERIRLRIAKKRFTIDNRSFRVTASMGIATLQPGSLKPKSQLMHEADSALYDAKAGGRNMVIISTPEQPEPALMQA